MVSQIAYHLVFGKPLIMYVGLLTFFSFLFTASIGYASYHGIKYLPFKWHPRLAAISITLAILHGILGLSIYFNF